MGEHHKVIWINYTQEDEKNNVSTILPMSCNFPMIQNHLYVVQTESRQAFFWAM